MINKFTITRSPDNTEASITDGDLTFTFGINDEIVSKDDKRIFSASQGGQLISIADEGMLTERCESTDPVELLMTGMFMHSRHLLQSSGVIPYK